MVKIVVKSSVFVEATNTYYSVGDIVEVSEKLFERHGPKGSGSFSKHVDEKPKIKK